MDAALEQQMRDLLDKQAITEVLFKYCRAIDRHDIELLKTVYHPDAEDYHGIYNGPVSGLFQLPDSIDDQYVISSHLVSNVLIELRGDFAHVESYLTAIHRGKNADGGLRNDFLRCRYLDTFERRSGEWRILKRIVVYDWGESPPAIGTAWWDIAPGDYVFGTVDASDPAHAERAAFRASR